MFKKAKRCNFRRRNDSEDEEKEENTQSGGPVAEDSAKPAACAAPGVNVLNSHGNGFQSGLVKSNKEKEKIKKKENREEPKASLLSFQDDEGNCYYKIVVVSKNYL